MAMPKTEEINALMTSQAAGEIIWAGLRVSDQKIQRKKYIPHSVLTSGVIVFFYVRVFMALFLFKNYSSNILSKPREVMIDYKNGLYK